ncbi:Uncharacterised protein [Escherichia coli]|nr:Uncharacterised protein [Escherichia coli]
MLLPVRLMLPFEALRVLLPPRKRPVPFVLLPVRLMLPLVAFRVLVPLLNWRPVPFVLLPVRLMLPLVAFRVLVPWRSIPVPFVLLPVRLMLPLVAFRVLVPLLNWRPVPSVKLPAVMFAFVTFTRLPLRVILPTWLPLEVFRVVPVTFIVTLFEAFAVPAVIFPPLVVILTLLPRVMVPVLLVLAAARLTFSLP